MGEPETHGERPETAGPVVMWQRWDDLLFLHWEFDPRVIQATLPPGLTVDTHAGRAWVGVVPFRMAAVRPRFLPPVPGLSWFWELNVRTYVRDVRGRPGVWFYSLDCDQPLACAIARRFFHLNYRDADMACGVDGGGWRDFSSRCRDEAASARLKWRPGPAATAAVAGSLDFFLVERYRLFAHDGGRGRLFSGVVAHDPYLISSVEVGELAVDELFLSNRLPVPEAGPVRALASCGVQVRILGVNPIT